jgi:hypothetical protein
MRGQVEAEFLLRPRGVNLFSITVVLMESYSEQIL